MNTLLQAPANAHRANGKVAKATRILPGTAAADMSNSEWLRQCAWEIGARRAADSHQPQENHVGLAQVTPSQGFTYWRIRQEWVDEISRQRGPAWQDCRLLARLYDVSYIEFNGLNAHRMADHVLPSLCGQMFVKLPAPGTWQIAEVGFLLRGGEFVPAARSAVAAFAPDGPSPRSSQEGLLVTGHGRIEHVGNVWDQERVLHERRQPHLRRPLRFAAFALAAQHTGGEGSMAQFVSELAAGQVGHGHEVHVFVPASQRLTSSTQIAGVHYQPLEVSLEGPPLEVSARFGQAAEQRLRGLAPFDAVHLHDWMAGQIPGLNGCPRVLSLTSIEASRRQDGPATELSAAIEEVERRLAREAPVVLTPDWLRGQAIYTLGLDELRIHSFPMEGRLPNEWEVPLDPGQVKMEHGVGPLDRLIVFVGPLEHSAGVDILLEALPTMLHRAGNVRLIYVGEGNCHGSLQDRAHQLGVAHAVRVLGHVHGPAVCRLLRSCEALVLPSRCRVPFDDAVIDLARRAGRPVITTHGGPAHLVRHEENGIVTYDNPGSMVWALDRVLGNPAHAAQMGQNGRRGDSGAVIWADVARRYLDLCAGWFPQLREMKL